MKVEKNLFGYLENTPVYSFTLANAHGVEVQCINYGGKITKIMTPDQNGKLENIVLGHDKLEDYVNDTSYLGTITGRVAGRIGGAAFDLNGRTYNLAKNDNDNHLHGGIKGFNKIIWNAAIIENEERAQVQFSYTSPDGEEGYPGNLEMKVTYSLNNDNEFKIQYEGLSDKTTVLNVTNHSYFNLSGDLKRDVQDHLLTLKSDKFLELDEKLLPTGEFISVDGTTFDFRQGRAIKTGVASDHPQNLLAGKGYDHPFVLTENRNKEIILEDPESGRQMTIETDEVGVVVYTSNQLSTEGKFYGVVPSRPYLGICLETQGLPDAVHHSHFPSWVLEKDKQFKSETIYRFNVKN